MIGEEGTNTRGGEDADAGFTFIVTELAKMSRLQLSSDEADERGERGLVG
jgi:hypothetical protein